VLYIVIFLLVITGTYMYVIFWAGM